MDVSSSLRNQRTVPTSPRAQLQGHVTETEGVAASGSNGVQRRNEWRKSLTLSLDRKRPARDGPDDLDESILPPISRLSGHPPDTGQTVKTKPDSPRGHGPTNGHVRHHHSTFRTPRQSEAAGPKASSKLQGGPSLTRDAFGLTIPNPVSPRSFLGHTGHNSPPTTFDWRDVRNRIAWSPERSKRSEWNRSFPDLSKHKPKQKVMKFLAEDNSVHLSPSRDRIRISPPLGRVTPHCQLKETRSPAVKNGEKMKSFAEPFSIRSKIEQFRKWHEDQFMEKLTRLKLETGSGNGFHEPTPNSLPHSGTEITKIIETSCVESGPKATPVGDDIESSQHISLTDTQNPLADTPMGDGVFGSVVDRDIYTNLENDATSDQHPVRPVTSVTWKTWRDVNVSDAYCNVDKYIRDNDLMDEEREQWIRVWITNVQSAMAQMEDVTRDASDCAS
ncbi:unnamed protein product [Lymnaea stagnalis]|uniref:Uncharacterized protein n=1 Tax=Lymnaea stagnalis TaxID=6523 RepID=A0AAV2IN55_LYMST